MSEPRPADAMPARAAELEVAEIDDELVVLVPADRRAHHLDTALALVFDACDGRTPVADVTREIADATSTSVEEVASWMGHAIQILREHHLVTISADGSWHDDRC